MNDLRHNVSVMAIINLTDDSFYSGSRTLGADGGADLPLLEKKLSSMLEEGADIIDFGACSTRPGSEPVSMEQEWRRLEGALAFTAEKFPGITISIDTWWSEIIRRAYTLLNTRASQLGLAPCRLIINDISSGTKDPQMLSTAAELGLTYIAMHFLGPAGTDGSYPDGVTAAVKEFFEEFSRRAEEAGVKDWILDPGFGFSKDVEQNWTLMNQMPQLKCFGKPILVGISRKRMIWQPLGLDPQSCLEQTIEAQAQAVRLGADILRVHDVGPTVRMLESLS